MFKTLVVAALAVGAASAALAQSAEDGERIFKKCKACHKIGEDAANSVGPVLTGVVGRAAGTFPDYKYSKYMIAAGQGGLTWDQLTIFGYLADPTKYLRQVLDDPKAKAKMKFKLKKEQDRRDVISYLATFSTASADMGAAPQNAFCVTNASDKAHFFAVETREGERQFAPLNPGAQLCSGTTEAADGIVSVFQDENGFEGCSRIVPVGAAEEMREYAEFDRCLWSSNDG
ncbi:MAG TPA: c-type cytochrome [Rhodobacteraceae bacterium]|nr:c-type cytochrome [Paracoccaceae bacterium]